MIITQLRGGLGNQLFQYAVARHLSKLLVADLKFDIESYKSLNKRSYELDWYAVKGTIANENEIARLTRCKQSWMHNLLYKFMKLPGSIAGSFIIEKDFNFSPDILNLEGNIYLSGYWQSEKYFKSIHHILLTELKPVVDLSGENLTLAEHIKSHNSVSIHVRRSDYIEDESVRMIHQVCPIDYYLKSMKYIQNKINDPHYYVFSDDFIWSKQNIKSNYPVTFVGHNQSQSHEDLRLMSFCKHNIIANSSFSWWGAWLNQNLEKIVIAPKKWFRADDIDTRDLIPEEWIIL